MENKPESLPGSSSNQTPNLVNNNKVIEQNNGNTANSSPPQTGGGALPAKRIDVSKIYPSVAETTPSQAVNDDAQQEKPESPKGRVATRAPAVMVYAMVQIIYSLYGLVPVLGLLQAVGMFRPISRETSGFYTTILFSPFMIYIGAIAINIAIGVYLLLAKKIQVVQALLTALLIVNGISLLNSIVLFVRFASLSSAARSVDLSPDWLSGVRILIAAGLFVYLWYVNSQVNLAALEENYHSK